MKRNLILGLAIVSAIAFVSCKSSESSYRKAYEKAQAQTEQQVVVETPAPAVVTTPTPAPVVEDNTPVRSERLNALNGNLKAYNVVCGSFKSLDNANRLAATLVSKGYSAQVAQNPETGMYRVVAETSDVKSTAVATRDRLRSLYPDAWILLRN
ncbi:MAG: SPOR domain-containing protein [Bacteroidaceae bacterium]|nr:SPOR domain-containing protein [Bacteroidaceae bacterium]